MARKSKAIAVLLIVSSLLCVLYWIGIDSHKYTRTSATPTRGTEVPLDHDEGRKAAVDTNRISREEKLPPTESALSISTPAGTSESSPTPKSWKLDSFCDNYIDHTLSVCNGGSPFPRSPSGCYVSPSSNAMGACVVHNMAIQPSKLHEAWLLGSGNLNEDKMAMWLLKSGDSDGVCSAPGAANVKNGEWIAKTLKVLLSNKPISPASCKVWVNETAYFFASPSVHIYFRFLVWYNLHKAIAGDGPHNDPPMIVRLSDPIKTTYLFPEYEKVLFPTLHLLTDFPDDTICFKKSVFIPSEFESVLFRCKMEAKLRSECFQCNGRGLTGTSLYTFRQRVIQACSLTDKKVTGTRSAFDTVKIVVVLRKNYARWKDDDRKIDRYLTNEQELLSGLKSAFPVTNVTAVRMEDISICEQIRLVHEADAFIGVHGAGLVHAWWLPENSILIELNPSFELNNPTFKMLSTLAGRRYQSINVSGAHEVHADVPQVVKALQAAL